MPAKTAQNFWVGVASRDHVRAAVRGGFCQFSHGKEAPVRRLERGDRIIYYSPRVTMGDGKTLHAFTAAGRIIDAAAYQVKQGEEFHPFRRKVRYSKIKETPIRPLLADLSFTKGRSNWGMAFRRGVFKITLEDYSRISRAMGTRGTVSHKG